MEVTVTGRRLNISDDMREQVSQRLNESISKLRNRVIRTEVEFTAQPNKGNPDDDIRCEITLRGKGPVVRAEGEAHDKMVAFGIAEDRLMTQLRKAADRRKHHRGLRAKDISQIPEELGLAPLEAEPEEEAVAHHNIAGIDVEGDGPLVVREKVFTTEALTLEQAIDEMELVGHDFFLYVDAHSRQPSVVYRRKAYNYGVIHLNIT